MIDEDVGDIFNIYSRSTIQHSGCIINCRYNRNDEIIYKSHFQPVLLNANIWLVGPALFVVASSHVPYLMSIDSEWKICQ